MHDRNKPEGLAERSMKNLVALEDVALGGGDVHLVTQLVVSLLALIVFPRERLKDDAAYLQAHAVSLAELEQDGWPEWKHLRGNPVTLGKLLEGLRHAISHGNVHFSSEDRQYKNVRLTFTNDHSNPGKRWQGEINGQELREFCKRLYERVASS